MDSVSKNGVPDDNEFKERNNFMTELDSWEYEKKHNNYTTEPEVSEDLSCGVLGYRPHVLNKFRNILTFSITSGVVGVMASVQTYFASQIPHLEKQFGLNSAETGLIVGWSRIGYLVFNLFGSSMAQLVHIPHFMFWSMIIYSIAGICLSFPYFVIASLGKYSSLEKVAVTDSILNISNNNANLTIQKEFFFCELQNASNMDKCIIKETAENTTGSDDQALKLMAAVVFSVCLFVMGIMYASRFPFTTVFIDDNINRTKTGFYLGFVYGIAIFGPALAFAIGGVTSKVYVTLEEVDFTINDPRWIGAWWLGFIVFSIATIISALPMICFPRRLKPRKKEETEKLHKTVHVYLTRKERIKERALSYWRVMTSPVYVGLIVINCITGFPWVGYWSFISKYITTQFGTPLWKGNMILAVSNIVSLCAGCFGGGIISRKVKMTPRNCLLINTSLTFVSIAVFSFGFITGCDQPIVQGPATYSTGVIGLNTSSSCINECDCNEDKFFPVCGSNGINYHSPCYAGCPATSEKNRIYSNCTCIPDGQATAGLCPPDCSNLYPWAVVNFFSFFTDAMTWMPMVTSWLRTVEDRDKSTAIGLQTIIGTLLSFMPAPIAYGKLIDTTCLIWESTCSSKGSCQFYDVVDLRVKLHAVTVGMKFVGCLCLCLMLLKVWNVEAWEHFQRRGKAKVKNPTSIEVEVLT